jgi:xanthine/uracil permease
MEVWGVYICYMITLAIGVAVSTFMCLITRRLLYKSWICRALLSLLFAAIITPVEMRVGAILGPHASYVAPAGFALLGDIRRGNAEWVVLSGILP